MKKHSRIVLAALAAIVSEVSVADDATAVACAKTLFGDNVVVFSPSDAPGEIDAKVESVFQRQHKQQFGDGRYALMFLPGDYRATKPMNVGYYTQLLGLGRSPTDVTLNNVKTPAALPNNNATCNFWVGIENLTIADTDNNEDPYFGFQWAVSQAAPARRLLVERKAVFDWFYGWASGGYVADCIFRKAAGSYSQQQYFTRNSRLEGKFYGINWNNVLLGCDGSGLLSSEDSEHKVYASADACMGKGVRSTWSAGGSVTLVDGAPVIREKPFVFWDDATSAYKMFVPALRRNAKGTSWSESDPGKGEVLDIASAFHVATPKKDDAKSINAALAAGKHIFLTPGIYRVKEPIRVKRAGTVFFGLGEATIIPDNAEAGMVCSDEDGIVIAGVIFDAGERSRHLLVVGEKGSRKSHAENPIVLQDVIYRVGGTGAPGRAEISLEVNSNDVIIDHTWVWRADHGDNTGWYANTAKNGIVVNGSGVMAYGLFVEHFQEYDVLWNGEDGTTYFLQNEKCYDPQGQSVWMSHGGKKKGYAAYKVADGVKRHYAVGLGVYDVFINTGGKSVKLDDAIEVPDVPGVTIENACIVEIANGDGPLVGINAIVNGKGFGIRTGKGSGGGYAIQRLVSYCNGKSEIRPDYYKKK